MGLIRLLAAPIRTIVRFPLFQLAFVVAIILLLQAADDKSRFGQIFNGPGQTRRCHCEIVFGAFRREVLHQIRAHSRLDDRLSLSCLFADLVPCACHDQSSG